MPKETEKAKKEWTAEQKQAFMYQGCNLLVSAGAGSGKTAVLVERVITHLTDPVDPYQIDEMLVVTFTKAAAAEMRQRIGAALQELLVKEQHNRVVRRQLSQLPQATITNLHAFCLDQLRRNFYRLGIDANFRIAGEMEQALLCHEVLEDYIEEEYEKGNAALLQLADAYGGNRDDSGLLQIILNLYQFIRSQPHPKRWLAQVCQTYEGAREAEGFPWSKALQTYFQEQIGICLHSLKEAGEEDDLPLVWLSILDWEIGKVSQLQKSYINLKQFLSDLPTMEFADLPRSKDGDREARKRFQKKRDQGKKTFRELQGYYCRRSYGALMEDLHGLSPLFVGLFDLINGFDERFAAEKRRRNLLDFEDMEHMCLQMLEDEENGLAQSLRTHFKEVLVDEYQDINSVQERIISLLCNGQNCFMVGDVKQSIYRFRLAEPTLFLQKFQSYSQNDGGKKIDLNRNFRSTSAVIDAVNFLFRQLMTTDTAEIQYDEEAALKAGREDLGEPAELHIIDVGKENRMQEENSDQEHEDEGEETTALQHEARWIAGRMLALREQGYAFRDMVVLLRSAKNKENVLAEEFQKMGIPAIVNNTSGYLQTSEILLIRAILQIIDNPLQDIPMATVLRSPLFAFSADDLITIRFYERTQGDTHPTEPTFYDALCAYGKTQGELHDQVESFLDLLQSWRAQASQGKISDLIWEIYRQTGLYHLAGALPQGAQRQANLKSFYDRAREYEKTSFRGLFRFLHFIDEAEQRNHDFASSRMLGENEDVVSVMSIHRSKGLEFPVVFLAGLGSRFHRGEQKSDMVWHKDLGIGAKVVDRKKRQKYNTLAYEAISAQLAKESLAEEMRILYVACTRARDKLILTATVKNSPKALERWNKTATLTNHFLPYAVLSMDASPLDWFCRALVRHADGLVLQDHGVTPHLLEDASHWQVEVSGPQSQPDKEKTVSSPLLDLIAKGQPLCMPETKNGVKDVLEYRYPGRQACDYPAKLTVTQLQKNTFLQDEYSVRLQDQAAEDMIKSIGEESSQDSSATRGTEFHTIMERICLQQVKKDMLKEQVRGFVEQNLVGEEWLEEKNIVTIMGFFATNLGQRLLRADKIRRETVFTYCLPAKILYPTVCSQENTVLQGMVDLLFQEDDGSWVLVDYKTGGLGKSDEVLRKQYSKQIRYYRQAISDIWGQTIKEAYLYLPDDGRIVAIR